MGGVTAKELTPNTDSWRDMLSSITALAGDKAKAMMEASKAALQEAVESKKN